MIPGGSGTATSNRDEYATNHLFKPEVDKLVNSINTKVKDISQVDVTITLKQTRPTLKSGI